MANVDKRLLVVDDESLILDVVRDLLELYGYQLETAISGADALDILAEKPIDLLLSDIMMPDMSGVILVQKARELYPTLKCAFMTGYANLEWVKNEAPVFEKPINFKKLIGFIDDVLTA